VSAGIGVQGGARGIGAKGIGGRGGDPLIELFDIWRDEISSTPLPPLPAVRRASPAVAAGRHRQQRTARPALFIAAAICALLIGSAAVGSRTAKPGDALWPLASVLWSDRLDSVHSLHEVNDALAEVQDALAAGRPDDAREALMRATVQLGHVDDLDMPASMPEKVQQLWDVIPDAERRSTQDAASVAAVSADPTTAQPVGSPSSTALAAGTPSASTPLLGTVLGAISASAQPSVSTDSNSTTSDGPSVPVAAAGLPTIAYPSAPKAVINSSTDAPTAPTTDTPPPPVSPRTPTPPPVTTEPAPTPFAAVPVVPTSGSTSSGQPTSTENSAPTPPPPSTEPDPAHVSGVDTSTPAGSADGSSPTVAGSDPQAVDPAAATP